MLASEVRTILRESGVEVGTRGRVSTEQIAEALALRPKRAREVAAEVGVAVGTRGRLSAQTFLAIAEKVHN